MYEDDVTDGYTANLHFGNSFFNQFNSPEVDLLSDLTPRSSDFNSTNDESSVSYILWLKTQLWQAQTLLIWSHIEEVHLLRRATYPRWTIESIVSTIVYRPISLKELNEI